MKKFFKRVLPVIISLLMACSMLTVAGTASTPPRASNVVFRALRTAGDFNFHPGSFYSDTDLFKSFKNVMPGDVLSDDILITNDSPYNYADIYLQAIPHGDDNPMSPEVAKIEESVVTMEDFLAQLYMRVYNGDELIYEASPDKTAGLTEPVKLGRITRGNLLALRVELIVPNDLGNKYAYRAGEVDWAFYAEVFANPGIGGGGGSGEPDDKVEGNNLTVKKYWKDEDIVRPAEITVYLTRDGEIYDEATLSDINQWTYTWTELDEDYEWSAEENVPEGYKESYMRSGNLIMITNTKIPVDSPIDPDETTDPDETMPGGSGGSAGDKVDPDETTPGGSGSSTGDPDDSEGTGGGSSGGPVSPGRPGGGAPDDSVGIGGGTSGDGTGGVGDPGDPTKPGGTGIGTPDDPTGTGGVSGELVDFTVRKEWAGDEDSIENRPETVIVTLFNGTEAIESVYLGEHNSWTYTWKDLSADGDWSAIELEIPKSYTPSYFVDEDGTVVITNTASLIQTGQMKWHIPVIFCIGGAFVLFGLVLIFRKRKQENE